MKFIINSKAQPIVFTECPRPPIIDLFVLVFDLDHLSCVGVFTHLTFVGKAAIFTTNTNATEITWPRRQSGLKSCSHHQLLVSPQFYDQWRGQPPFVNIRNCNDKTKKKDGEPSKALRVIHLFYSFTWFMIGQTWQDSINQIIPILFGRNPTYPSDRRATSFKYMAPWLQ